MTGLVNYGSGNISAIANILDKENIGYTEITKPSDFSGVDKLILPGVSSFDRTIELLKRRDFVKELNRSVLEKKIPILGICVGMQIMFEKSEEGSRKGLGWIKGSVIKLRTLKTPHLGWNSVSENNLPLTKGVCLNKGFYFLHSYKCTISDAGASMVTAEYDEQICAVVVKNNIVGVQFHPEKSHVNGIRIFKNFDKFKYE